MINVCKCLNSKDIASYLREAGYELTTPETAFIVYQSHDTTMDEKIAAWLEIADTMPDCPMEGRLNMRPIPSFHASLHDYVEFQKRELERFFEPTGFVYSHSWYEGGYVEDGNLFGNAEDCIAYVREHQGKNCCGDGAPQSTDWKRDKSTRWTHAAIASYTSTAIWKSSRSIALVRARPKTGSASSSRGCDSPSQLHSSAATSWPIEIVGSRAPSFSTTYRHGGKRNASKTAWTNPTGASKRRISASTIS